MSLTDSSGSEFVSVFDDWGKVLLGVEAKEVAAQREAVCCCAIPISQFRVMKQA